MARHSAKCLHFAGAKCCAMSPTGDRSESIKYEGTDMVVCVNVKKEAHAALFTNHVCDTYPPEAECIESDRRECPIPAKATRIQREQYLSLDSESTSGIVASSMAGDWPKGTSDEATYPDGQKHGSQRGNGVGPPPFSG